MLVMRSNVRLITHLQGKLISFAEYLNEKDIKVGGQPPLPKSWIPELMDTLGLVEWTKRPPSIAAVRRLLAFHKYETTLGTPDYKKSVEMAFLPIQI